MAKTVFRHSQSWVVYDIVFPTSVTPLSAGPLAVARRAAPWDEGERSECQRTKKEKGMDIYTYVYGDFLSHGGSASYHNKRQENPDLWINLDR